MNYIYNFLSPVADYYPKSVQYSLKLRMGDIKMRKPHNVTHSGF